MITPVCLHLSLSRSISMESQSSKEDQSLLMEKKQEGYTLGWQPSKKKFFKSNSYRRRPKVPSVRLGGKKKQNSKLRGVYYLVRLFRKMKLRWLKLQYSCLLKRLKSYYYSVVKDLIEAGATLQSVQQTIMMESTYFAVPVMGVSIASIPFSRTGSNRVH